MARKRKRPPAEVEKPWTQRVACPGDSHRAGSHGRMAEEGYHHYAGAIERIEAPGHQFKGR